MNKIKLLLKLYFVQNDTENRNWKDGSAAVVDSSVQSGVSCQDRKVDLLYENGAWDGAGDWRAQDDHWV